MNISKGGMAKGQFSYNMQKVTNTLLVFVLSRVEGLSPLSIDKLRNFRLANF